jgi:hypothetical protein
MTIMMSTNGEIQVHQEMLNDQEQVTSSVVHSLNTGSSDSVARDSSDPNDGGRWVSSTADASKKPLVVKQSLLSRSPLLFADQKASGKVARNASGEDSPKRAEVIRELLETERQYVADLGVIINVCIVRHTALTHAQVQVQVQSRFD